jgi:hypothetical protein
MPCTNKGLINKIAVPTLLFLPGFFVARFHKGDKISGLPLSLQRQV